MSLSILEITLLVIFLLVCALPTDALLRGINEKDNQYGGFMLSRHLKMGMGMGMGKSSPTLPPAPNPAPAPTPPTGLTVGVFYYPWHTNNFHNGEGYLRKKLIPQQSPELGEYDDSEEATIRQHLQWCMDSNIFMWIMSWWGPNSNEDVTIDIMFDFMENEPTIPSFPVDQFNAAIFYETRNRIREIDNTGTYDRSNVRPDLKYLAETYFGRPNHFKINGKPVLFVYLTRWLYDRPNDPNLLQDVIDEMRAGAAEGGFPNIYIVGDHAFRDPTSLPATYVPFSLLDAVTNYDVFGAMGRPLYADASGAVQDYLNDQQGWNDKAGAEDCGFIPSITPGFNRAGFNPNLPYGPMSRRLNVNAEEGSLFEELLKNGVTLVDEDLNIIVINSFNEWHEDTQIEPVATASGTTNDPMTLTEGLLYESYGTLYLDLVKEHTEQI